MIRIALVVTATAVLAGCATVDPTYYQRQSTAQICHGLMTLPSYNVNHPARWAELQRRGESCGNPVDVARAQQGADAANNALLMQSATIMATPPPRPVTPVTCVQNGRTVTCY